MMTKVNSTLLAPQDIQQTHICMEYQYIQNRP
jgi:hypothetical protein